MNLKKIVMTLLALLPLTATAQLTATKGGVDFGVIREAEGPKSVRTYVRNDGEKPITLVKVRPSCGCTAAAFQKEPVEPGDSAWIDLTYNPNRRPGKFEKNVKVYPSEGETLRIPVRGVVFASEQTVNSMFPASAGIGHLSETTLMPARSLSTGSKNLYADYYNDTESPVWLSVETADEAVEAQVFDTPVAPGEITAIGIYLKADKESRSGSLEYRVALRASHNPDTLDEAEPVIIKVLTEK